MAQVWSLTSWCPLLKDDLPLPHLNLASHTWKSVLPVLRRRTNMSQLGNEISGRPEHWAGVTVPYTGVLTYTALGTPATNSASPQTKTPLGRSGATDFTTEPHLVCG